MRLVMQRLITLALVAAAALIGAVAAQHPLPPPTDLASIGCDEHIVGYCDNATWVYCIDA